MQADHYQKIIPHHLIFQLRRLSSMDTFNFETLLLQKIEEIRPSICWKEAINLKLIAIMKNI